MSKVITIEIRGVTITAEAPHRLDDAGAARFLESYKNQLKAYMAKLPTDLSTEKVSDIIGRLGPCFDGETGEVSGFMFDESPLLPIKPLPIIQSALAEAKKNNRRTQHYLAQGSFGDGMSASMLLDLMQRNQLVMGKMGEGMSAHIFDFRQPRATCACRSCPSGDCAERQEGADPQAIQAEAAAVNSLLG